jgi:hypothetical protein
MTILMKTIAESNAMFLTGNVTGDKMSPSHALLSDAYWYIKHVIPIATVIILLVMAVLLLISQYFPRFATGIIVNATLAIMFYVLYVFLNGTKEVFE